MNPTITPEGQAAANRIKEFRQNIDNGATAKEARATVRQIEAGPSVTPPPKRNLGTVSANQLSNPVDPVTVPQPQVATISPQSRQLVTNISRDNNGFIENKSAEVQKRNELEDQFSALNNQGSLSDLFNTTRDEFGGGSDSLKELKDIQLQLKDMDFKSGKNKDIIQSGGQGAMQGERSLTQEDREAATRSTWLAARASVIQGNIQTANAAAKSAVDIAYQDRTLKSTNLLNQISMVQSKVDKQTAQLLETEKRGYEADLAAVKELKDATQNAIVSGASQAEVSQLMDSTVDDATKLALAQTITARGAGEMRGLDIEQSRASIRSSNASAALNEQKLVDEKEKQTQIQAAIDSGAVILNADQQDTAMKLSKDFVSQSSDFKKQVDAYNRIVSSAEDPSAAGDVAVVFNYMKMLDPGSVVRESEFALAASTGSLDEALQNKFGKLATGEILGFTRDDFVDRAGKLYNGSLEQQIDLEETMRSQAIQLYGMPENAADLIISDVRATGAVSEVVFGLTIDGMSDEQLLDLSNRGLLPKQ